MKKCFLFIFCFMFLFTTEVLAHPGRTDSNGGHTCRTNCSKWGLNDDEYHYHNGNTYTNSKGQIFNSDGTMINNSGVINSNSDSNNNNNNSNNSNSNSNNHTTIPKENSKSSDNTLKSITIDGNNIEISDEMSYSTFNEIVEILVETNDSKASYDIENPALQLGSNIISIKVTAENGTTKNYNISIMKEQLSNNVNIKIFINEEETKFVNNKATVYVSSSTEKLNYKYILEDKNAKVEVNEVDEFKFGDNIMIFKVIAQDDTEMTYELTIHKYTKKEETISAILGLGTIGAIGYGICYFLKKRKTNKSIPET